MCSRTGSATPGTGWSSAPAAVRISPIEGWVERRTREPARSPLGYLPAANAVRQLHAPAYGLGSFLRTLVGDRWRPWRRPDRAACRRSDEGRVDPRGSYPARYSSAPCFFDRAAITAFSGFASGGADVPRSHRATE